MRFALRFSPCLSTGLERDCLTQQHRPELPSTSATALLKYPRQQPGSDTAGHIAHADVGSLTLLFSSQGGLQVLHPALNHWVNIKPVLGYEVVNTSDSLRHLSQQNLKSCLHRVLPCTSAEAEDRFSAIYFMRPEKDASFLDETGKEWKSIEWHVRKFDAFRNRDAEKAKSILRGRF